MPEQVLSEDNISQASPPKGAEELVEDQNVYRENIRAFIYREASIIQRRVREERTWTNILVKPAILLFLAILCEQSPDDSRMVSVLAWISWSCCTLFVVTRTLAISSLIWIEEKVNQDIARRIRTWRELDKLLRFMNHVSWLTLGAAITLTAFERISVVPSLVVAALAVFYLDSLSKLDANWFREREFDSQVTFGRVLPIMLVSTVLIDRFLSYKLPPSTLTPMARLSTAACGAVASIASLALTKTPFLPSVLDVYLPPEVVVPVFSSFATELALRWNVALPSQKIITEVHVYE